MKLTSYLIAAVLLLAGQAMAKNKEMPPSFHFKTKSNAKLKHFKAPKVDIAKIKSADQSAELAGAAPAFAAPIGVELTPANSGSWQDLQDDKALWRLKVSSKEALSLNLGITNFYLPEGAKFFFYSEDYSQVRGPFTSYHNNDHNQLWTPVVMGEEAVLEIVVPNAVKDQLRFTVSKINHDYRGFGQRPMQKSGSCNVDVACQERAGWESQIKSVAVISTGGRTFCTGFLVNNTANDQKPLFMTANHCRIDSGSAPSLVAYWNYENTSCREPNSTASGRSGDGKLEEFTSGATFRAGDSRSDFVIVEFNQPIDPEIEVFYAGWNATTADPTSAVAIHHPNTDEKRISFEYDALTTTEYSSNSRGEGTHLRVADWDVGTTEPGSSGSPLFDQDQRVVGQLHGGGAACGNDEPDWYGRISYSWNNGLKEVLDPIGSGELFIDGIGYELEYSVASTSMTYTGLGTNNTIDPGETVTATATLKNLGTKPITDLIFKASVNNPNVQLTNPQTSFIAIPVGGQVDVTLSMKVESAITCGAQFELETVFEYAGKMKKSVANLQVGKAVFISQSVNPGMAIPDDESTGITSMMNVQNSNSALANDIQVMVDIEHTYIGDLLVRLTSPAGTSVILHNKSGEGSEDIIGTYPTTLQSAEDMSAFNNDMLAGDWTLKISDHAGEDIGTLRSWGIKKQTGWACE